MSESPAVSAALQRVKPMCMELVKSPSLAVVQGLLAQLKVMDCDVAQQLQHFLVFPLRTTLMACVTKSLSQQVLIDTCHTVQVLMSKSQLQHGPLFMDLFSLLSDLLLTPGTGMEKRKLSEEEKVAAIQTLSSLLSHCHLQVLHQLYVPTSVAQLGGVVSQLVAVVSDTSASRSLRGQALSALLVLLQKRTYVQGDSWWQHGNRFAGLLPGISTTMLKVLLGDSKQGHQLFCKSLEVWTAVVCLTLDDESLALEQKEGYAWIDTLKMPERLKGLVVRRDAGWVEGVGARVGWMVTEVGRLKKSDHWRLRRQLATWADSLLSHCRRSLQSCVSPLLEVLVLLVTDDYQQVAAPARAALDKFRNERSGADGRQLTEILKEDLFSLLTSLPRRIRMEDEEEKRAVAGLLVSYISLIGQDLWAVLLSQSYVKRLTHVLVQVLEMDVTDMKILEQQGMGAKGLNSVGRFVQQASAMVPRKVFAHFRDDRVKSDLLTVCRLLGKWGDVQVVVESVMEVFRESAAHRLPCMLILNEALTGYADSTHTAEQGASRAEHSLQEIVRLLLEEYLSPSNMGMCDATAPPPTTTTPLLLLPSSSSSSTSSSSSSSSSFSSSFSSSSPLSLLVMNGGDGGDGGGDGGDGGRVLWRNRAVMLTCLLLEGVAVCSKVLGREFRGQLTEALYPVMEKVGSEMSAVSGTAFLTLCDMAAACHYQSVDELIQSNADYIVTSISLRLWRFEHHPRAPSVLSVMLQLCETDVLPLVWDSIMQIVDTLDDHHADQALTFLPVLHHLTLAVHRWFPAQNAHAPQSQRRQPCSVMDAARLVSYLKERRRLMLDAENFQDDPDPHDPATMQDYIAREEERRGCREEEEEEEEEEVEEEGVREPPLHVKVVKEVLQRAQHMVSSSDPRLTLLALEVIAQGCADLADHENELLPIIHQLWPSFKQRFHDAEKLVVIKAVKTLQRLCDCCGDFIRRRVEKDVLPSLRQFLHTQAKTSMGCGRSYQYTVNFKLQLTLLSTLGPMALQMGLDSLALEAVLQCCVPYLSQSQPMRLQQACVHSVKQMALCDADVVWLTLCHLYTPSLPSPPSPLCKPVTIFQNVGKHNEYTVNVTELLQHLDTVTQTGRGSEHPTV